MSTEIVIGVSDCLDVQASHKNTYIIEYSNEFDFAGIIYDPEQPKFEYLVTAKFFKEVMPEENESVGLSDNSVAKLSSETKFQKVLQVEPAPFYVHRQLKLILQHNYIMIDEQLWEKEEAYAMQELNERSAFQTAEAPLTAKENSLYINVFGTVTQ